MSERNQTQHRNAQHNILKGSYRERRAETLASVNEALEKVFKDAYLFDDFLNILSRFREFSTKDSLFLAEENAYATAFKTYEEWNRQGFEIKGGETGYAFPDFKSSENKFVFEAQQTKNPPAEEVPVDTHSLKEKMRALLSNNGTRIGTTSNPERTNGQAVYYDNRYNMIIIDETRPVEEIYAQLAVELAHAEFAHSYDNYDRSTYNTLSEIAGCVICKRNNVTPEPPIHIPQEYKYLERNKVLEKLELAKQCTEKLQYNIDYYYKNGQDKQERYKPPIREEPVTEHSPDEEISSELPIEEKKTVYDGEFSETPNFSESSFENVTIDLEPDNELHINIYDNDSEIDSIEPLNEPDEEVEEIIPTQKSYSDNNLTISSESDFSEFTVENVTMELAPDSDIHINIYDSDSEIDSIEPLSEPDKEVSSQGPPQHTPSNKKSKIKDFITQRNRKMAAEKSQKNITNNTAKELNDYVK